MDSKELQIHNSVVHKQNQERMKLAVDKLTFFIQSYPEQIGYENYSDKTFIDDMLYGIGIALDQKYSMASGYRKFKQVLKQHIEETE